MICFKALSDRAPASIVTGAPSAAASCSSSFALSGFTLRTEPDSLLPSPEAAGAPPQPPDAWYREALAQALTAKLVNGVSDTAFAPEAPVTR
ncbi:S-layer homology domain-containing protein, partial [Paenibacillus tyrfis]|uniref:S-layer homology domain-containing protein n=1 Tax=Paenibacillus tyrfis TaxID=1501230 RepID=UPI0038996289